ncbi:AbrB/MazE/SpoVT family DNA-binding domain-containing protein [Candidatus Peregrinibacteria bacterium]|nr:AbrB/MazE/SpoVT family DNA-binding domain-containing protein [Candidatus Peregrinibacteria bacterium]
MTTVTLSPKFQIVLPKEIREELDLSSGMKFEVVAYAERIQLIPLQSLSALKGSLKGMDTTVKREKDRL